MSTAPAPLTEISNTRQIPGEPARRWFTSAEMDLIVWLDEKGQASGFQLCYDKPQHEHALTWLPDRGFVHMRVDDGDRLDLAHKKTPLLVANGSVDAALLLSRFNQSARSLPTDIMQFVSGVLRRHPDFHA